MSVHLPFVMQQLFNRPLAADERTAHMLCAALSGQLNISSLQTMSMPDLYSRRDLADMARLGRAQADDRREAAGKPADSQQSREGWWGENPYELTASGIAIIDIWGTLTRTWGVGPYSGCTGYDGIVTQIAHAENNPKVRAKWLQINSGGGAVDGLFDTQDYIWSTNEKNGGKYTVAYAGDHAYSAAFALAVGADKVYCPQAGGVGSVGVIMIHAEITEALAEAGVSATVIRSGARKAKGQMVEKLDPETLAHWQGQCDEVRDLFVDRVAHCMGIAKSAVSGTEGLDYMGLHAKAIGFVNDVLPEQEAWAKLERKLAR